MVYSPGLSENLPDNRYSWELEFAWLPHTCNSSGKRIWWQYAYRGVRIISGPGEPICFYRWLTSVEYLIKQIKDEI
jgi:hypothetical protein